jgi:hypothetical protein
LRRYLDLITSRLEAADWSRGCAIGTALARWIPQITAISADAA